MFGFFFTNLMTTWCFYLWESFNTECLWCYFCY